MNIVTICIVSNEWYMVYDINTKEILTTPNFIDSNTSAPIGIIPNIKVEVADTEQELLDLIKELELIVI